MARRARNPETGEVVELRDGQWVPVSSEPEGSPVERLFSGVWETTAKPVFEIIPELVKNAPELMPGIRLTEDGVRPTAGAQMGIDLAKGAYEQHKEQLLKALEEDQSLGARGGHLAAALLPLIGPAAAEAGERAATGDVAGGIGEGLGLALPFLRPLRGAARAVGSVSRASGAKNIARALKTPAGLARKVMDRAEPLSKELGVGSVDKLSARAAEKVGQAKTELEALKAAEAERVIPTARINEVRRAVTESADPIKVPESRIPDLSDPAQAAEFSKLPSAERQAFLERVMNQAEEVSPPKSLYTAEVSATDKLSGNIQKLVNVFEEAGEQGIPASEVFKMRSQMGRQAAEGGAYSRLAGQPIAPGARAARAGQAELTQQLKEAIPGLAEADLKYSDMRLAGELLENAAAKGAVAGAPAFEILGGRGGLGAALGALGGGLAAGPMGMLGGAGLGYGGYAVAREILNSPFWNSLSGRGKFALAKQLGSGGLATATAGGSAAGRALEANEEAQ